MIDAGNLTVAALTLGQALSDEGQLVIAVLGILILLLSYLVAYVRKGGKV